MTPRVPAPSPLQGFHRLVFIFFLGLALGALSPLSADWLVLRDGHLVETTGPWRIEGERVVFKLAGQSLLSSVGGHKVDLEASRELTRRRQATAGEQAEPPAQPPQRKAVMVLTDKDVRKVHRPMPSSQRPAPARRSIAGGEEPETDGSVALAEGLEVANWRQDSGASPDTVVIEGELRNRGRELALGVDLTVELTASDGTVVGSREALLSATTLAPRQRARFRAELPKPVEFDRVEFSLGPEPGPRFASVRIREHPEPRRSSGMKVADSVASRTPQTPERTTRSAEAKSSGSAAARSSRTVLASSTRTSTPAPTRREAAPVPRPTPTPAAAPAPVVASTSATGGSTAPPPAGAEARGATSSPGSAGVPAAGPRRLADVTFREVGGVTEVRLVADSPLAPNGFEILRVEQPPAREVIKIFGPRTPYREQALSVGTGDLARLRTGFHRVDGRTEIHVVADLTGPAVTVLDSEVRGTTLIVRFGSG